MSFPNSQYAYSLVRVGKSSDVPEYTTGTGSMEDMPEGTGLCFHTYQGAGDPLPPFEGDPYAIRIPVNGEDTARYLWANLNPENRVGVAVREIDSASGAVLATHIINKLVRLT